RYAIGLILSFFFLSGAIAPAPTDAGAPPRAPAYFHFTMKVGKGVSGGKPPEPPWGALSSPQRRQAPLPPERGATPGSLSVNKIPAAPRIDSRKCFPGKAWGENKARLPTSPKWQIDL